MKNKSAQYILKKTNSCMKRKAITFSLINEKALVFTISMFYNPDDVTPNNSVSKLLMYIWSKDRRK